MALVGCATGQKPAPDSAAAQLLPFTYALRQDGGVRAIQEAPDGSIWFDNGVGVSRFDGERITTPVDHEHSLLSTWALAPDDL